MLLNTKTTIHEAFHNLEDPRQEGKIDHPLINIIFITLCGILCGADEWTQIATFGHSQVEWLSEFLDLSGGIPSHDTFGRTFALLDPEGFGRCFTTWVQAAGKNQGKQIAVDGKVMCGTGDKQLGRNA